MRNPKPIRVAAVDLDREPEPLDVESRYEAVLLVPRVRGKVLGQMLISATGTLSPQAIQNAVERRLGDSLWRTLTRSSVERAVRGGRSGASSSPAVSVVVEAREGTDNWSGCLDSLAALRTSPAEILISRAGE